MERAFEVVTDVDEIASLNEQLAAHLSDTFHFQETREITYPSGHHTGEVYFEDKAGERVRAWAPHTNPDKLVNFILFGQPGGSNWLEITVQLNFPAGVYNRRMAGAFVKDFNGEVFIAHRGKLTKGRAGLQKKAVFGEFASRLIEAIDGPLTSTLILIASLDDPNLADRLCEFAAEAREVATRLGEASDQDVSGQKVSSRTGKDHSAQGKSDVSANATVKQRMLKLRKYFDEYSGIALTQGHGGGKRTVEHGDIVKALEALLNKTGDSQKAQAIDLAVILAAHVDLFEVKTSARTTDVYTGVGQLLIHGECISELLKLPVHRFLVLPERPNQMHEPHIVGKGGMRIVTYEKVDGSFCFAGI